MSAKQVQDGVRPGSRPGKGGWAALFAAPEFYRERRARAPGRFESVFEPVVLVAAIVLFSLGAIQLGLAVAPTWPVEGLLPLCGLTAIVAYLYSGRLARATLIWREWLVLLLPILLVTRFLPYALTAGTDLAADASGWLDQPLAFFEMGFLARAALLIGAWATAFYSAQDLADVRVQPGEVPEEAARTIIERAWESDRIRGIDHTAPFRRLIGRFLQGGVALLVMAALTASNVGQLVSIEAIAGLLAVGRPSSALALIDVLAYFVAVLLLMAEAQYVRMRTLWTLDRVVVAPGIEARWGAAGVALVGIGLVAALLAPTEGLLGIADLVRYAMAVLFFVASYVMAAVYLLFWLITYPLRWLLGSGGEDAPAARALPPPPPPPVEGGGSLLEVVKSLLFWGIFAAIVGYSLFALWRQGTLHRVVPGLGKLGEAATKLFRALARWVLGLLRLVARGASALAQAVLPLGRGGLSARRPAGWLRDLLPGGDPRRIVIATYALVTARAAQRGIDRPMGETASEYRLRLRAAVPDAADEVDQLTATFLAARYGPRPVDADQAGLARRCWRRIREGLRSTARR